MGSTYYHNPRCSKSRLGHELLTEKGLVFTTKEYLKDSMTVDELLTLFKALDKSPSEVVRIKEDIFKQLDLGSKEMTNEQWAQVIIDNPVLLERPILLKDNNAVIGRPTENLLKLI